MTGIVTRSSARAPPPASTADAKLAGPLKKRAVVGATDPPEKSRHQDSCAHTEDKSDEGMMREAGEVDDVPDCPTPPTGARATRSPYSPDPEHAQPQQLGAWWAPLVRAEATAQRGQEKNQPREKRLECERDVRPKRSPRGGKTFTMTRPTEPPAAGLGVRVERPGQDRRLLPRRDLPNGPKALWTSHVRRSPPRRFDDTSRDRAPPNQALRTSAPLARQRQRLSLAGAIVRRQRRRVRPFHRLGSQEAPERERGRLRRRARRGARGAGRSLGL